MLFQQWRTMDIKMELKLPFNNIQIHSLIEGDQQISHVGICDTHCLHNLWCLQDYYLVWQMSPIYFMLACSNYKSQSTGCSYTAHHRDGQLFKSHMQLLWTRVWLCDNLHLFQDEGVAAHSKMHFWQLCSVTKWEAWHCMQPCSSQTKPSNRFLLVGHVNR